MKVCSLAISTIFRCDWKSFVNWKASVRVKKEKMTVVKKKMRWDMHDAEISLEVAISTENETCTDLVSTSRIQGKDSVHVVYERRDRR